MLDPIFVHPTLDPSQRMSSKAGPSDRASGFAETRPLGPSPTLHPTPSSIIPVIRQPVGAHVPPERPWPRIAGCWYRRCTEVYIFTPTPTARAWSLSSLVPPPFSNVWSSEATALSPQVRSVPAHCSKRPGTPYLSTKRAGLTWRLARDKCLIAIIHLCRPRTINPTNKTVS
jgi:hypothetical protein